MSTSRYDCNHPGCGRGRATGHAIHRTSPKGQLFYGSCEEHLNRPVDTEVAVVTDPIEDRNQGMKR